LTERPHPYQVEHAGSGTSVNATCERPSPIVLFIDKVAELFLVATRKEEEQRDEMVTQLIRLAQLGRAAGIHLEVCGQRFGAELGKGATMLRAQLTGCVCHRVNDEASAKMALGDIAPEASFAVCAIAAERPGLAVAGDTSGGWSRIRTPYPSLADAASACRGRNHARPRSLGVRRNRPQHRRNLARHLTRTRPRNGRRTHHMTDRYLSVDEVAELLGTSARFPGG
jgi:hypothetical protein